MTDASVEETPLRRQWGLVDLTFLAALVGGGGAIAAVAGEALAARWAVGAAGVAGFELWFLYRHLGRNRDDDHEGLYRSLGGANGLTLLRGVGVAGVAGFALVPPRAAFAWVPALLYGGAAALDRLDGYAARATGRTTVLGEKLDMAVDTLGFLVAPLVGVLWGRLPVWYLSLSLARYLFRAGRGLRRRRGRPVYGLPPSRVRRPLAGVQMAFIAVALAPVLPAGTVRVAAAVVLVPSLAVFARDYLAVVGVVGPKRDRAADTTDPTGDPGD
ncbi:MAG: CDP-alcohol phosphatidyltransferase family protein [Halobacteriales archaeon]